MSRTYCIRLATVEDGEKILAVYAPFIRETAVTFETEVPAVREFCDRVKEISEKYPFFVCEKDGEIAGYAYASKHRERAAYLYNVEVSIYVLPKHHGGGIAHELYTRLFETLKNLGYKNAYAIYTEPNEKSKKFHQRFGFEHIGTFRKTGYKFKQWHDVTWMGKTISEHDENPRAVTPIRMA